MPRFDLNVSITLPGRPLPAALDAAAALGFDAVEFWWPGGADLAALARHIRAAGLQVALFNLDGGDLAAGERGLLNDPLRLPGFRAGVPAALEFAAAIGCPRVHALLGRWRDDLPRAEQLARIAEQLAWLAEQAAPDVTVLVEALNTFETPGYVLDRSAAAIELIAMVGAPNLALQYDVYHMQRMEGNICARLAELAGRIGHIQVADTPHRGPPGSGELDWPSIFDAIDASGYRGFVGLEFMPRGDLAADLAWLPPAARRAG